MFTKYPPDKGTIKFDFVVWKDGSGVVNREQSEGYAVGNARVVV